MSRRLNRLAWIVVASVALGAISWALYRYERDGRPALKLGDERQQLQAIATRLTSQKRALELMVAGRRIEASVPMLSLILVEYARKETSPLSVREVVVAGEQVHVDAKVIRFEPGLTPAGDPLLGVSVALFTRIYGDQQKPEKGEPIDPAGEIPEVYRGADLRTAEAQGRLWGDFWKVLVSPESAREYGAKVIPAEATLRPEDQRLYTLWVEADGKVAIRSEPLRASYGEAIRRLKFVPPATEPTE